MGLERRSCCSFSNTMKSVSFRFERKKPKACILRRNDGPQRIVDGQHTISWMIYAVKMLRIWASGTANEISAVIKRHMLRYHPNKKHLQRVQPLHNEPSPPATSITSEIQKCISFQKPILVKSYATDVKGKAATENTWKFRMFRIMHIRIDSSLTARVHDQSWFQSEASKTISFCTSHSSHASGMRRLGNGAMVPRIVKGSMLANRKI